MRVHVTALAGSASTFFDTKTRPVPVAAQPVRGVRKGALDGGHVATCAVAPEGGSKAIGTELSPVATGDGEVTGPLVAVLVGLGQGHAAQAEGLGPVGSAAGPRREGAADHRVADHRRVELGAVLQGYLRSRSSLPARRC